MGRLLSNHKILCQFRPDLLRFADTTQERADEPSPTGTDSR
jgi:hypothetical protein